MFLNIECIFLCRARLLIDGHYVSGLFSWNDVDVVFTFKFDLDLLTFSQGHLWVPLHTQPMILENCMKIDYLRVKHYDFGNHGNVGI